MVTKPGAGDESGLCTGCKTHLPAMPFPLSGVLSTVTSLETQPRKDTAMNSYLTPEEAARRIDAAKLRSAQLREQAISEFWGHRGDDARNALRSARRLAGSLARHTRLRGHQGA